MADVNRPRMRTLADGRTIPDAMSLDWSDLVHVATKAIESEQAAVLWPLFVIHAGFRCRIYIAVFTD